MSLLAPSSGWSEESKMYGRNVFFYIWDDKEIDWYNRLLRLVLLLNELET